LIITEPVVYVIFLAFSACLAFKILRLAIDRDQLTPTNHPSYALHSNITQMRDADDVVLETRCHISDVSFS
jgi:hypothetical protein